MIVACCGKASHTRTHTRHNLDSTTFMHAIKSVATSNKFICINVNEYIWYKLLFMCRPFCLHSDHSSYIRVLSTRIRYCKQFIRTKLTTSTMNNQKRFTIKSVCRFSTLFSSHFVTHEETLTWLGRFGNFILNILHCVYWLWLQIRISRRHHTHIPNDGKAVWSCEL